MSSDRNAGVPPAVSGASRPRFGSVTIRDRGRLPHMEAETACYFVTFRLADSLPQSALRAFLFERQAILATAEQLERELSQDERRRLAALFAVKIERYLDAGCGSCALKRDDVAALVAGALGYFDSKRYRLLCWCVMPNHVHVVAKLFPGIPLASVLHSWKSFTAHKVNQVLGRRGPLWAREYYDHLVRSPEELARITRYVLNNPIKAGLKNWRWCGRNAPTTAGETPALRGTTCR